MIFPLYCRCFFPSFCLAFYFLGVSCWLGWWVAVFIIFWFIKMKNNEQQKEIETKFQTANSN